jgi:hypothetical protein
MKGSEMRTWALAKSEEQINRVRDVSGLPLLMAATARDRVQLIRWLVHEKGANVHEECGEPLEYGEYAAAEGSTAIHYVKSAAMMSVLIEAGADLAAPDALGRIPVENHILYFSVPSCVERFLQDPRVVEMITTQRNEFESSILVKACYNTSSVYHNCPVIEMLLNAGVNPTLRDSQKETARDFLKKRFPSNRAAIKLLRNAEAAPERTFLLVKARFINDAAYAVTKAEADAEEKGLTKQEKEKKMHAAVPAYLKGRVEDAKGPLPLVELKQPRKRGDDEEEGQKLTAALNYVLCLGEHKETGGMPREVFLEEFMDMIAPIWDEIHTGIPVEKPKIARGLACLRNW